jgi:Leucine-rich repeat (LRR) protein
MELYLGNNMITDIREIVKLKDLPRLIILDISCNPGANNQSNRVYCIFHLRKLRVLDGISIDPQEHLEAKETFSGRLTEEIMSSRLQGRKLTEMRELDLSNCKLRDFEDMFDAVKIPNIRELNLNNNLMSSLRCLGFLPTLKILRLKSNKIETLYCKPNPEDKVFKKGLFGMPSIE